MHPFTALFLAFLVAGTALKLWLALRQMRAVRAGRARVPAPFDARVTLADHHKAADYTLACERLGMMETLIDAALLLGWTLGGGLALLDAAGSALDWPPLATGVAVIMSAFVIMAALSLPFGIYRTFAIEARYGFNRTTPSLFVTDQLKALLLTLALGTPLALIVLWLMRSAGAAWWLYAWLTTVVFSLAITWIYPTWLAPLFNKFTPLANSALEERITALLERCGFRSNGIFVMDGSRRSSHGNAYFTGLGTAKRIVFFDTLLSALQPPEIEAVLAHELGHFSRRHVRKRMLFGFSLALVAFAVLGWVARTDWFYTALGVQASPYMAVLLFTLISSVFTFPLTPVTSWLSRRHEFEADAYATEQADAQSLAQALVKLYRDNATTLTPDALHSRFYDSHPPAPIRVARLGSLATR